MDNPHLRITKMHLNVIKNENEIQIKYEWKMKYKKFLTIEQFFWKESFLNDGFWKSGNLFVN
jgi:hypothetical protein